MEVFDRKHLIDALRAGALYAGRVPEDRGRTLRANVEAVSNDRIAAGPGQIDVCCEIQGDRLASDVCES